MPEIGILVCKLFSSFPLKIILAMESWEYKMPTSPNCF